MTQNLNISLTKAQSDFLQLECPFPLFVAGLGSGKSYLMGLSAVLAAQHSGKAVIGLYEPSWALIREVAMPNVMMWLDRLRIGYTTNKNEHIITTDNPHMGNFMFKSYQEVDLLIGYETYAAFVDEIDTVPMDKAQQAWDKIVSRNRQQIDDVPEQFRKWSESNQRWECSNRTMAFTSPEGFKFCYRRWVQLSDNNHLRVHGRTADNPGVSEDYIRLRTQAYTPQQQLAYLEGQFVNLTSGTVYSCFDRESHRSTETITSGENLYIGMDFNVYNMSAKVFVSRQGGAQFHCVAELDGVRDTPEIIQIIKDRWESNGHKIYVYPDASGGARHSSNANASASDIAQLRSAGFSVRARSKNPDVRDRVAATNAAFSQGNLFVNDLLCPKAADCLEQQVYDKTGRPDKDAGQDHSNDAFSYFVCYEKPVRKKLFVVPVTWAV